MEDKQYAQAAVWGYSPDDDDIAEVEDSWNEKIPDHLLVIGGLDGWNWASVYYDPNESLRVFRGEFRDGRNLYKGLFKYSSSESQTMPENMFQDYYMITSGSGYLEFMAIDETAPVQSFILTPLEPEKVMRVYSQQAERYRAERQNK